MNANELANKSFMELWDSYTSKKMECEDLHEKICQQQTEIEALKQIIDANNLNQNIGQFVKPTNEPVAWIDKNTGKPRMEGFIKTDHDIPLYTHPVKEFFEDEPQVEELQEILQSNIELTDDEWIITYQTWALTSNDPLVLKRAILRKAQKK